MIYIWFVFALLCALFLSLTDLFVKKYSSHVGDVEIAFGRILFALPILWLFSFIDGIPTINSDVLWVYLFGLPLELLAIILYVRSLRVSPLSLTVPFLAFTPVFLLITSPIMMGEFPSRIGTAGVVVIAAGAYSLNAGSLRKGILYPLRMIISEKGSIMMLVVAFIYSITSNLGKMGIIMSSPTFFAASYFSLLSMILFFLVLKRGNLKEIFRKELIVIGILSAIMITFHMIAIKLIFVSYMIATKRISLLFGIIFGVIFFKEGGLREKLFGGFLMIAGILIIAFYG